MPKIKVKATGNIGGDDPNVYTPLGFELICHSDTLNGCNEQKIQYPDSGILIKIRQEDGGILVEKTVFSDVLYDLNGWVGTGITANTGDKFFLEVLTENYFFCSGEFSSAIWYELSSNP